jgi:hypothetical protein
MKLAQAFGNIQTLGVTQKQGISLQADSTICSDDII